MKRKKKRKREGFIEKVLSKKKAKFTIHICDLTSRFVCTKNYSLKLEFISSNGRNYFLYTIDISKNIIKLFIHIYIISFVAIYIVED